MISEDDMHCPLCNNGAVKLFSRDRTRDYLCCERCDLVFVPPAGHPTPAATTLDQIWSCLAPGSLLAIMTQLRPDRAAFEQWHYRQDFTHVAFFSVTTFQWLGAKLGATVG